MAGFLTSDVTVRVGAVVPRTVAEGPGVRFAVWVQGCSIRCDGCFNPHLWAAHGGQLTPVSDLVAQALGAGVEGVTLLGGEPFEQADELAVLASAVRDEGLSVMTFTGYTLEHLRSAAAPAGSGDLLAATDLLVDGPYIAEERDTHRPWVGSTNQRFHFLSERYQHLQGKLVDDTDRIEVRIGADGTLTLNGWAPVEQLDMLLMDTAAPLTRGHVR